MKKILSFLLFFTGLIFISSIYKADAIPSPWIECGDDISCGSKKAGFNFPLKVNNYQVRAMEDMIEITFPYKRKDVTVRKSTLAKNSPDENGIKDISGDYNIYPKDKVIKINNGILFNVRGDKNRFYVANFAAETGYYSFSCKKGLKTKDINYFYNLLKEAEAPRYSFDEKKNYTIEQLQDLRRIDDIVEPVYTQDCFPKTLQKRGVTFECFERANLGQDDFCSESEIKLIKEYYKKGQNKDPLNDGSGNFCADNDRY